MPDESEVEVQATQLRMMAESFRVENGSSTADALIGSYADDMGSNLTIRKTPMAAMRYTLASISLLLSTIQQEAMTRR